MSTIFKLSNMTDIQFEKLINSLANLDVQDKTRERNELMKNMLKVHHIYGYLLKEFADIVYEYQTVYGDLYFFNADITEMIYDIEYERDDRDIFFNMNGFIKFINKNVPGDFKLSDVIYCLEKYDQ
jgi:hypothetical protein